MFQYQLDFFKSDEDCKIEALCNTIEAVKTSSDKVRRGTYASIGEVKKECLDLKSRLEILERNICKGDR